MSDGELLVLQRPRPHTPVRSANTSQLCRGVMDEELAEEAQSCKHRRNITIHTHVNPMCEKFDGGGSDTRNSVPVSSVAFLHGHH